MSDETYQLDRRGANEHATLRSGRAVGLFTTSEGVVSLKRVVAQDGVRVRASAGAAAFRRQATLEDWLQEARTQVEALKGQVEEDPSAVSRRRRAARERAARERQERLERALARVPEIKAKQGKPREEARLSSTAPQATVMKMGDGGFRPAYNAQVTADTASQVIVGVEAATIGTDSGQLTPMREQLEGRYGKHPEEWLVDGGYATHEQIEQAAPHTTVYAPVPKARDPEADPHARKAGDSEAVAAWRERRATEEARAISTERAATAESVNALARQRGLTHLRVRCVLLLHALAHNLMRTVALAPQLLGYGGGAPGQPVRAT